MNPPTRGSVTGIKQKIGGLYKDCCLNSTVTRVEEYLKNWNKLC